MKTLRDIRDEIYTKAYGFSFAFAKKHTGKPYDRKGHVRFDVEGSGVIQAFTLPGKEIASDMDCTSPHYIYTT